MKMFKLSVAVSCLLSLSNLAQAQWVAIPNGGFANYLQYTYPDCMDGYMLDTTCADVINASILNIPSSYNATNLEGVQYFDNLTILTVNYHPISTIPYLPQSLIELNAAYCNLSSITNFPSTLQKIEITSNNLTSVPSLPDGLVSYYRSVMPNLPIETSLPASLEVYYVSQCNVIDLPPLPDGLLDLSIGGNYGINIPELPAGLITLGIDNLNLTSLPPIPNSLTYLWALENSFTVLDAFPPNLELLYLNNCSNLTTIENLPNSLLQFYAPDCNISYIDFIPNSVFVMHLQGNDLSTLPNFPNSATMIDLQQNNLTSLPTLPTTVFELFLSNNLLTCIPYLPESISYINLDNNDFTCLPNILPAMSATFQSYPLCEWNDFVNNPYGCPGAEGIEGYVYQDENANCQFEVGDVPMNNVPVTIYDNADNFLATSSTFINGRYFIPLTAGEYTVVIDTTNKPYTVDCNIPGLDSTVVLNGINPLETNVNFGLECKPGFDIGVQAVGNIGIVFPGQIHVLNTIVGDISNFYNMNCADGVSGSVTVTVEGPVTFQNVTAGSLTPSISGNVYTYTVPDFGDVNPVTDFRLDFKTDSTAIAGDLVCVAVEVTPLEGDNQPSNNNYTTCYPVVNSYDPNNKVVYPTDISPDFAGYLTYTINFQNTGNAPAFNIHLEDTLSSYLDVTTFEVMDYSDDMYYQLTDHTLQVYFPNIMLLDTTTSEPESKGHVTYRIKPLPGMAVGDVVENTAHIYFDFNPAIITNTAITTVTEVNHIVQQSDLTTVSIYPNPTNGVFHLQSADRITAMEITDQQGRPVACEMNASLSGINLSKVASGIYFVKVTTNEKREVLRVFKN